MAIGIRLTDKITIELGEIKEKLFKTFDDNNVKYSVPFDKVNNDGFKETIVHIESIETEISIKNDIINYVKLGKNKYTTLDKIEDIGSDIIGHIHNIQKHVENLLEVESKDLKIEKIDTTNMNITFIVTKVKDRARIQVLRDSFGDVYINTLRAL